jgi:GNAT superfamily N-acetyltransferase
VPFPGENASAFVAEQDGELAGGFRIRHMTVTCREALLRCGGISSVAVAPAYRQRGVGSAMMTWALAHMRASGWQVTALHAIRESYYRRFGWECAGRRVQITCPQWRFPRLTCGLPVQQLRLEDWAALEPAYRTFAMAYSGMALRQSLQLSRITMSSGNPPLVYAVGDPVEAYAILRLVPRTASNQEIAELVWATSAGYQALLATLSALCIITTLQELEDRDKTLVETHAKQVQSYNALYGEHRLFHKGEYNGKEITIYQYQDRTDLILILAHELGHALGLAHVDDRKAVMYELLSDQDLDTLTLTSADVRALHAACSRK